MGGGINESVTWICSSCGFSCSKLNLSIFILSASGLELGLDWGLGKSQSDGRLVSPVCFCVFVCPPVQCLADQSDSLGEGCRIDYLQNLQDGPNLAHALTESGTFVLSISVVSILVTDVSEVLGLLVFMGLYLALFDHLALIMPGALFLG